ncbi:MAG: glycosyltransferase family 39 protein [Candidatus Nomurabacteria bacterium]|nr:glycosyltransferase family 39 protein [Candidatus Nomurabacteria bacterium]
MKNNVFQKFVLYRWRFLIGFSVLAILTVALAAYRFWDFPDGLISAEMTAATTSGGFSLTNIFALESDQLINLPWTVLQSFSIKLFGFNTFAFRLPAVILMILTAIGLIWTIYKWFNKKSVALTSGFLIVPSMMFMSLARGGDGSVMVVFLMTLALFSATMALYGKSGLTRFIAKVGVCLALSLLLYSVGGIYVVLVLIIAGMIHPKTRLIFLRTKPWKLAVGGIFGLAILSPMIMNLVLGDRDIVWTLLASGGWSMENLRSASAVFTGISSGFVAGIITPIFSVVGLIFAVIGLMKIYENFFSARSYLLPALLLMTVALLIYQSQLIAFIFVPLALLMAIGVEVVLSSWLTLFPLSSYARLLATILVGVLLVINGWLSISYYFASISHDETAVYNYNGEFEATRAFLAEQKDQKFNLVVNEKDVDFYQNMTREFSNLTVITGVNDESKMIVLTSADKNIEKIPTEIITSSRAKNPVLLRVY